MSLVYEHAHRLVKGKRLVQLSEELVPICARGRDYAPGPIVCTALKVLSICLMLTLNWLDANAKSPAQPARR